MLKIEGLSKTFNQDTPLENRVIDALSLKVERKDFITLLGSNGAGKSTLLNLIAGTLYLKKSVLLTLKRIYATKNTATGICIKPSNMKM